MLERAGDAFVPQRVVVEALRRFARSQSVPGLGALLRADPAVAVAALLAEEALELEPDVRCRAVPGGRATTTMVLKGVRLAGEGTRIYERLEPREAFVVAEEAKTGSGSMWRVAVSDLSTLKRFMEPFGIETMTSAPVMVQTRSGPGPDGFTGLIGACTDEPDDFRVWSFLRCETRVDGDSGGTAGRAVEIVWPGQSFAPPPFLHSPPTGDAVEKVLGGGGSGDVDCLTVPFEVVTAMMRARIKSLEGVQTRGPIILRMLRERMLSLTPLDAEDAGHSAVDLMQLVRSGRGVKPVPKPLGPTDLFLSVPRDDLLAACTSAATYGASHVFVTAVVERVTDSEGRRSVTQVTLNLRSLQTSLGAHQRWFRGDLDAEWGSAPPADPVCLESHAAHHSSSRTDVRTVLRKCVGLYLTKWLKAAVALCPKAEGDSDAGCHLVMRGTDKPLLVAASFPGCGLHHLMRLRPASRPDVTKFSERGLDGLRAEGGAALPASWKPDLTDV